MATGLWAIAGANGVGKIAYAFRHVCAVSGSAQFVNLDEPMRADTSGLPPSRAATLGAIPACADA